MARRGSNSFRRNDAMRAIKSARDSGIEPAMVEVIVTTEDGTVTYRVYGEKAAGLTPTPTTGDVAGEDIAKLTKPPKAVGRGAP
jgi:hypothetical protein